MQLKLPELGEGVHEGELVKWRIKEGDVVKDDQLLCDIMTDKATIELPSPFSGQVLKILVKEGQVVHVGQDMLEYEGKAGAVASVAGAPAPTAQPASAQATLAAASMSTVPAARAMAAPSGAEANAGAPPIGGSSGLTVAAAPSTRRFAREAGADLAAIAMSGAASGPAGRIMREDVEKWIKGGSAAAGTGATRAGSPQPVMALSRTPQGGEDRVPFKGLRKKIAEKMALSKSKAAHFTYVEECDATALVELRTQGKDVAAKYGIKLTYLPFVMKAMVSALRRYPILNATLDEATQELVYRHYYNIGLSIQTDDGLTAPNIKNVEKKSVLELAQEIQDLVARARQKRLNLDDLHGGTITLTNAGSIGGLFATPIVNFPEVAILGFNKIDRKPVVKKIDGKEQIVIRDWTLFSISLDHRIVDGAVAAEFLKLFISFIENPSLLLLEGN